MHYPNMILKPGKRASIALPWRGSPSANFEWLKQVCGTRTRPAYDRKSKRFLVARNHTKHVLDALVAEYGAVEVTQYGNAKTTCVEQCWDARPDTVTDCECACAGANHGSGGPMGNHVEEWLSVRYEYTRANYLVTSDGWTLNRGR